MNSTLSKTKTYKAKVKLLEKNFADLKAGQRMAIGTPELIKKIITEIPKGQSLSFAELRKHIAEELKAEVTCPVTTSIYLKIVIVEEFGKALEEPAKVNLRVPFWRAVSSSTKLFSKLEPPVQSFILKQRSLEGLE